MDYHSRHGHDVCSFDLPSTHRLPTVSAAQALEELNGGSSSYISTSVPGLDRALSGNVLGDDQDGSQETQDGGGIGKGQITEFWGPPGIGKTTMGIQLAANVLHEGKSVVWVDCFHTVHPDRLTDICTAALAPSKDQDHGAASTETLDKLVHFACPSLAHFIALLCRPTQSALPTDTALIVVDSFSALINHAFPRAAPPPKGGPKPNNNKGPSPASRRIQVLQYIVGALQKLAATRDAAVVVLTQCATRMQAERGGATLVPAVNTNVWDQGIASRVALYRDWVWDDGRTAGARLATVQKVNGQVADAELLDKAFAFEVESTGLVPRDYDGVKPEVGAVSYQPTQKRKYDETGFEIPDSEGDDGDVEDYGWGDDDDSALPRPPPQWQGSEDIILGQHPETDDVEGSPASGGGIDSGPEAKEAPEDDDDDDE